MRLGRQTWTSTKCRNIMKKAHPEKDRMRKGTLKHRLEIGELSLCTRLKACFSRMKRIAIKVKTERIRRLYLGGILITETIISLG
jgi:hypothetical protein